MGVIDPRTPGEGVSHTPSREELDDLFRPVEEVVPRWVWRDALRFRAHRDELGARLAYGATLRMLVRLQAAVR